MSTNLPPPGPLSYEGQVVTPSITRTTDPTTSNTGFPVPTIWINHVTQQAWILVSVALGVAEWVPIGGVPGEVESITVDAVTAPGTNPVLPDGANSITVTGAQVPAGTTANVIRTDALADNAYTIEIQRSQAVGTSTIADNGVCHFDSGSFNVDANAFVTLKGGSAAIDSVGVDAATGPGTNPVVPDANGLITVTGGQVASGTTANVIRSNSLAANAYTVQVQRAGSAASTTPASNGVCHFDNHDFVVDANAYVSLAVAPVGFSEIVMQTFTSTGTYTPTAGMVYCIVEIVGGGGGGAGSGDIFSATEGGGGGAGGYVKGVYSAAAIGASQTVTIGSLGAGGAASTSGSPGTSTTFGALMTAGGGGGGTAGTPGSAISPGGTGGTAAGGSVAFVGNAGGSRDNNPAVGGGAAYSGGYGASSFFGGSPVPASAYSSLNGHANGSAATTYGAGGGGGCAATSQTATGGNGFAGICIVTEYCS